MFNAIGRAIILAAVTFTLVMGNNASAGGAITFRPTAGRGGNEQPSRWKLVQRALRPVTGTSSYTGGFLLADIAAITSGPREEFGGEREAKRVRISVQRL